MFRRRMTLFAAVVLVAALALAGTGCTRVELGSSEPGGKSGVTVPLESVERADVRLSMGAGELTVSGGTDPDLLMDAEFDYRPGSLEPTVDHDATGSRASLEVRQPRFSGLPTGQMSNSWDIRLSEDVPLDLDVSLGAGESNLMLAGLDLRDLRVSLGAGDVTVDLTGEWRHDLIASVEGGAGSFTIRVPADVGVRVRGARDGLGSFEADGMRLDGDAYLNDAYGSAPMTIELQVTRGVGDVRIEMED